MYKTIVKPTLVLTVIAVAISALLALTYNLTGVGEASAGIAQDKLDEYAQVVLPGASFKQADLLAETAVDDVTLLGIYQDENGNGCALNISAKGYHGKDSLDLFIAFDKNGAIAGIYPISTQETPSLGSKVTETDYLKNYIGKDSPVTVSKDGSGDIDAIAGATISSNSLGDAINAAFLFYEEVKGGLQV